MRISDMEMKKALHNGAAVHPQDTHAADSDADLKARIQLEDAALIEQITADVLAMGDRKDMVSELKAKIESGEYNPRGEEIVEAMIRRAIADRVK